MLYQVLEGIFNYRGDSIVRISFQSFLPLNGTYRSFETVIQRVAPPATVLFRKVYPQQYILDECENSKIFLDRILQTVGLKCLTSYYSIVNYNNRWIKVRYPRNLSKLCAIYARTELSCN